MKIQQFKKYTLALLIALGFSACGGGSNGSFESGNSQAQVDINIPCVTNPVLNDIDTYITLNSGDVISKSGDVTIVTYHDIDGNKKVCKDQNSTGSAYILR